MKLIPLGDRIMVRPAKRAEQTTSGLWLSEHRKPEMGGTVVAVGPCPHPLKAEAELLADDIEGSTNAAFDSFGSRLAETGLSDHARYAATMLRDLVRKEPLVSVGDYVVFSWQSGQELWVDDERLLIMRESDVLAVVG